MGSLCDFEVYCIHSSEIISVLSEVLNFSRLFSHVQVLSFASSDRFSPIPCARIPFATSRVLAILIRPSAQLAIIRNTKEYIVRVVAEGALRIERDSSHPKRESYQKDLTEVKRMRGTITSPQGEVPSPAGLGRGDPGNRSNPNGLVNWTEGWRGGSQRRDKKQRQGGGPRKRWGGTAGSRTQSPPVDRPESREGHRGSRRGQSRSRPGQWALRRAGVSRRRPGKSSLAHQVASENHTTRPSALAGGSYWTYCQLSVYHAYDELQNPTFPYASANTIKQSW